MSNTKIYVLDSNVFIEARKRYYSFTICPGFWSAIHQYQKLNIVETIDRVKDELKQGKDNLYNWIDDMPAKFCENTDSPDIINCYQELINWANKNKDYYPEAKVDFISSTDAWLIAYAKAKNRVVVTEEIYRKNKPSRIPIPNVCKEFDVEYIDTFKMLDYLNVSFVLKD